MYTAFKQTKKVGVAGSFINQMMGNNASTPKVGDYATILHYTDRTVVKVVEVSADLCIVKVQVMHTVADRSMSPNGELPHGHQCWKHEPTEYFRTIKYRRNKWVYEMTQIVFVKEFAAAMEEKYNTEYFVMKMTAEEKFELYSGQTYLQNIVEGKTKAAHTYPAVSILFGCSDYYYDWSF